MFVGGQRQTAASAKTRVQEMGAGDMHVARAVTARYTLKVPAPACSVANMIPGTLGAAMRRKTIWCWFLEMLLAIMTRSLHSR